MMRRFSPRRSLLRSAVALCILQAGGSHARPAQNEPSRDAAGAPTPSETSGEAGGLDGATKDATAAGAGETSADTAAKDPDTRGAATRAYQSALAAEKLGAHGPLSFEAVAIQLEQAEEKLGTGRRDEAIADLVYFVESPRFAPFATMDSGRNAVFLLGDALGRGFAHDPARAYLRTLIDKSPPDVWARRAVRSLVDFGLLSDRPEVFLEDLKRVPSGAPEEMTSDVAYLAGRTLHRKRQGAEALAELGRVTPRSRFWAQATYLSGLIEVGRGKLKDGEAQFCKIADVKRTPASALAFGGSDFFEVRDLARLGLGRIAHEEFRFDDARYYYYLVPNDSGHLPEALYESANSRYEAKDYRGARALLDEMRSRGEESPYSDEVWVFDAYVDLALCEFPRADEKLKEFLRRYEPVRNAARRVARNDDALTDLVAAVQAGAVPGGGRDDASLALLATLLRQDPDYGVATRRLSELEHQMSGLGQAMGSLDDVRSRLASPKEVRPRTDGALSGPVSEQRERIRTQLSEVRRLLEKVKVGGGQAAVVSQLEEELHGLEARFQELPSSQSESTSSAATGNRLPDLVVRDRALATSLFAGGQALRNQLSEGLRGVAKDALARVEQRLSRLLRRARLGRIETVLGKKRAVEIEMEALSEGYLPDGAVDSLDAARYLRDDEEYWPFEGEDWADEYVGGEGLR